MSETVADVLVLVLALPPSALPSPSPTDRMGKSMLAPIS